VDVVWLLSWGLIGNLEDCPSGTRPSIGCSCSLIIYNTIGWLCMLT
jgi:hypothetical protein